MNNLYGKVLRINSDGTIPRDNPFRGRTGVRPEIYAYGFRDPEGAALDPRTGQLWTTENGPRGGDEMNLVRPGRNYGFPAGQAESARYGAAGLFLDAIYGYLRPDLL